MKGPNINLNAGEPYVLAAQDVAREETTGLPTLILTRAGEEPQHFVMTPEAARATAALLVAAADEHGVEVGRTIEGKEAP